MPDGWDGSLARAIQLAATFHDGQNDLAGEPYILHPLRVMARFHTNEYRIAAVLHDIVEDTSVTLRDLARCGFSSEIVAAIDALTRRDGEDYFDYIRRAKTNPIAKQVKRADLDDNLTPGRIENMTDADKARGRKYLKALAILEGVG